MIRLANTLVPNNTGTAQSVLDLFRNQNMSNNIHRPIPAPEPNPEPNPSPDGAAGTSHRGIAPEDWDKLFHAVTARLEGCVNRTKIQRLVNQEPGIAKSLQVTVLECVSALNQLHVALVREREQRDH